MSERHTAEVQIIDVNALPGSEFRRWDIEGHQINRSLVSAALTGTPDVVVDVIDFPPGFVHHMHRHPHADQLMYVLEGSVRFFGEIAQGVEIGQGHMLVIPRDNWHEVRNVSDHPCRVLHIFAGAGSVADIGLEHHSSTRRKE